jgi:hypothetical protein
MSGDRGLGKLEIAGFMVGHSFRLLMRWWLLAVVAALFLVAQSDDKRDQNFNQCRAIARLSLAHDELEGNMSTNHSSTGYVLTEADDLFRECMQGRGYANATSSQCAPGMSDNTPNVALPECFNRDWLSTVAVQIR